MFDGKLVFVIAVFALAGLVKGVIGLGLPTISMGLLAIVMAPLQAAAILVLPSFLTNVWQMIAGPSLKSSILRLWPFLVTLCLGTWAGAGLMTAISARTSNLLLGGALLAYAATALRASRPKIARSREQWLGPVVGVLTGLVTAATGVFVVPAVPYLEAVEMEKEEFIQALGLSFTVSTIALAINLFFAGALAVTVAGPTLVALVAAGAGVGVGQMLRLRLSPAIFRRCFFIGLSLIGLYLVADALV
jgi:uncharacterized membrane protein YfcA